MMNLCQILAAMEHLGYDRYRIDGDLLSRQIACRLFEPGRSGPSVGAEGVSCLDAMRNAVRVARQKDFVSKQDDDTILRFAGYDPDEVGAQMKDVAAESLDRVGLDMKNEPKHAPVDPLSQYAIEVARGAVETLDAEIMDMGQNDWLELNEKMPSGEEYIDVQYLDGTKETHVRPASVELVEVEYWRESNVII